MENIHHRQVKRFFLDGVIGDEAAIVRLRGEYTRLLDTEMRLNGYVPRLDINPDFTIHYNEEKEHFEFMLSMYGVHVGKKKSEWITGIDETRIIYTLKSKSNVSS